MRQANRAKYLRFDDKIFEVSNVLLKIITAGGSLVLHKPSAFRKLVAVRNFALGVRFRT